MTTKVKGSSWIAQDNEGFVCITDNGCTGDGATDNTAAFATILALALPVYIPPGTSIIGPTTVPANAVIFGHGTLKLKAASTGHMLTVASGTLIKDIVLDGNKSNMAGSYHAISCVNAVATKFINLKIQNTYGDGISISGTATEGVTVARCDVTGFTRNGFTWAEGNDVSFINCNAYSSDVVASPGDGFAIVSTGNSASNGKLIGCTSKSNIGRGFAFVGSGSKNVTGILVSGCHAKSNTGNGFHALTAQRIFIDTCIGTNNGIDGFRIEGDTQNCRLSNSGAFSNTSFGIREVTTGSTPNLNGIIYSMASGNGTDTITKVGAGSFIYSS